MRWDRGRRDCALEHCALFQVMQNLHNGQPLLVKAKGIVDLGGIGSIEAHSSVHYMSRSQIGHTEFNVTYSLGKRV